MACHENNRDILRICPDDAGRLHTVHSLHLDIEEYGIKSEPRFETVYDRFSVGIVKTAHLALSVERGDRFIYLSSEYTFVIYNSYTHVVILSLIRQSYHYQE